jgi:hypothetical protein
MSLRASAEGTSSRKTRKLWRLECEREGASSGLFILFFHSTARAFALALSSEDGGAFLDDAPSVLCSE